VKTVVFFLSAAILAYQIVLMRLLAVAQWHHFAAMIISIALLGFGLSGTLLAGRAQRWRGGVTICAVAFLVSVPLCTWIAQQIPFLPLMLVWQPRQFGWLVAMYLTLLVPFTCGALGIGLALHRAHAEQKVGRVYAVNLLGSGVGAVLGLALCHLPLPAKMSAYKALPATLAMAEARVVRTEHHPLGRLDVVECPALQVAPGLSLAYAGPRPRQQILFVDGDGGSAVDWGATDYTDWLTAAAPYAARPVRSALVIGAGGGRDLRTALRHGVSEVTAVEMHPGIAALVAPLFPEVRWEIADGRAFIRRTTDRFDLIQISLLDSLGTSATGIGAANETYLYTVTALEEMLGKLTADGMLCLTRWLKTPPRDEVRLFATAVTALERTGIATPGEQILFLRGWVTGTILVKRSPFTPVEIAALRAWAAERLFDVDYFPGVRPGDVNQFNQMPEPSYYRAALEILTGNREEFYRLALFRMRPVTDNQPYLFHVFRWQTVPHLVRTLGRDWVPFVEWGYVVLVATLAQAALASLILLAIPWWRGGRSGAVFGYFACLGLGFMFLEVGLLQQFTLFLGNPLYAATIVIATFLIGAGLGASQAGQRVHSVRAPVTVIVTCAVAYALWLTPIFGHFFATSEWVRVPVTIGLLAPLTLSLGMMFPLGLARVLPARVPWAWGVNGCCSVLGAGLASVVAMDFGFRAVLMIAAILYAVAGVIFVRLSVR
jgi:hypothetical protein